ncbi:hypothetical protein LCGC14_2751730 [marine sediment metagenome]|uniref:Uncharacterized protein n=1 Tax=marine sediment metagenome TaxID=412755 RepID=A0A0F8Z1Q2_9ZZZZ
MCNGTFAVLKEIDMKKIKVSAGQIGREYVTPFGKIVQLVTKTQQHAKILVLATDTEIAVHPDYAVYDLEEDTENRLSDPEVRKSGIISISEDAVEIKKQIKSASTEKLKQKEREDDDTGVEEEKEEVSNVKEPSDSKIYASEWGSAESLLLYRVKKILNAKGLDLIKKRMWKDGHMMNDMQQYLRERKPINGRCLAIYSTFWALRGIEEDYNKGEVVLTLEDLGKE